MNTTNPFDYPAGVDDDFGKQKYLIRALTLQVLLSLIPLAVISYFYGTIVATFVALVTVILVALCYGFFLAIKQFVFFTNSILAIILAFTFFLLFQGGIEHTGFVWIYLFPIASFGSVGLKRATIWMALFYLILVVLLFLARINIFQSALSVEFILQIIFPHIVLTIGTFLYEKNRKHYEVMAYARALEVSRINTTLSEEVIQRKNMQVELAKQVRELERIKGTRAADAEPKGEYM